MEVNIKLERIWNSTKGFILEETNGAIHGIGTKNKLLYTFYGGTEIRSKFDECYSGPEYLIEVDREEDFVTITIARQTDTRKKIFTFRKLEHVY